MWLTRACRPILLKSTVFIHQIHLAAYGLLDTRLHTERKVSFPWGCREFPENSMSFACSEKSQSIPGLWPPCTTYITRLLPCQEFSWAWEALESWWSAVEHDEWSRQWTCSQHPHDSFSHYLPQRMNMHDAVSKCMMLTSHSTHNHDISETSLYHVINCTATDTILTVTKQHKTQNTLKLILTQTRNVG